MMFIVFPLIAILVVSCQSLLVFYVLPAKNQTDRLLAVFSGFLLLDASLMLFVNAGASEHMYISTAAPFGLIYGPLLFWLYNTTQCRTIRIRALVLHFFPAFIGFIFYLILLCSITLRDQFLTPYLLLLYSSMCFSWIVYLGLILGNRNRTALLGFGLFKYGIVLLCVLTSYIVPLIWASLESGIKESALTTDFVVIGVMLAAIMLTYWHLFRRARAPREISQAVANDFCPSDTKQSHEEIKVFPISNGQKVPKDVPVEYKNKIVQYMLLEKYFDPSFSLKQMAQELNLPPSLTSQYFMQIYPDGFVKTVNQRRIEKACTILQEEEMSMNMEEIAFLCGFNSRASFYRNFNAEKGCSPTVYRERFI